MKAVIMAGGKGTRLFDITGDEIPKPMATINGKPILLHQIEALKQNGIFEFILVVCHKKQKIIDYFKDGKEFGVIIHYIEEQSPLGTAGAFYYLKEYIDEDFLLVFGDTIFDINIKRMIGFHREKKAQISLFIHPNSHPFDSDLVLIDSEKRVTGFDSKLNKRDYYYKNLVNAGFYVVSKDILNLVNSPIKTDFEKDIIKRLIENGEGVFGYVSSEYIKDVGTVERLKHTGDDIANGVVSAKNLSKKQKAIFIDRDGTLNEFNGLVHKPEMLEVIQSSIKAVKLINRSKYLAFVVTNQPIVARGLCSLAQVDEINNKLETEFGKQGGYFDDIIFCPHHPDKGYPEENPEFKVDCDCRKPKIGMVLELAKKFNIDLNESYFVGDTTTDIKTGLNAGVKTALVLTGEGGKDKKYDVVPDIVGEDLLEVVKILV